MANKQDPTALDQILSWSSAQFEYEIHWTSLGSPSNPPLVFIHGTPWSSRTWAEFALAFSSHFQVFLFDNPGYGKSPGGRPVGGQQEDLDASLAGQAEAFAALMKHCGLGGEKKLHVVAHDNGGNISLRGTLVHGLQYASLCLLDVVAIRPYGSPFFRHVMNNRAVFEDIPEPIFNGALEAYIDQAVFKPLPKEVMEMLKKPWLEGGKQGKKAWVRQVCQADPKHLEEIDSRYAEVGKSVRVKIIWGKEDVLIPVDRADKLAKMIGAEQVVLVADAGHLVQYDQPALLGVELAWWLKDVSQ